METNCVIAQFLPIYIYNEENSMWIANQWKDYEVIDCSKGEKAERWGNYILVRPDPQIIWDTPKNNKY